MKNIEVKLFGAFKKHVTSGRISVDFNGPCTAGELKKQIQQKLLSDFPNYKENSLVFESALATDKIVLSDEDIVSEHSDLALLPPVCGG